MRRITLTLRVPKPLATANGKGAEDGTMIEDDGPELGPSK